MCIMVPIFLQFLSLPTAALAVLGNAKPAQQRLLVGEDVVVKQDKVPGHNDVICDTVPKEEQILDIKCLEITPTPIVA
jgi:hypothetical protein